MVRGHTKFQVDSHFGMVKKKFQNTDCYTMDQIESVINDSSEFNRTIQFPFRRFKEFRAPLDTIFNDIKGIASYQCFWFSSEWLGSVKTRRSVTGHFSETRLLKPEVSDYAVTPTVLPVPGIQLRKQEGLFVKVRPFIPDEYKDILCPQPVALPGAAVVLEQDSVEQHAPAVTTSPRRRRVVTDDEMERLVVVFESNPSPAKATLEDLANELQWDMTNYECSSH